MTHCKSAAVALRLVCRAGNATLTTVPSMKAMLEARIVAASTPRPRDLEHDPVADRDLITFSSQGSRTTAHILVTYHCQGICSPARVCELNLEFAIRNPKSACARDLIPATLGRSRNYGRQDRINPDLSRGGRAAGVGGPQNPSPLSNSPHHRRCRPRSDSQSPSDSPRTGIGLQSVSPASALSRGCLHFLARLSGQPSINSSSGDLSGPVDHDGDRLLVSCPNGIAVGSGFCLWR